jgi:hypothetical protein
MSEARPPRAPTLPLKLQGFGTARWQLSDDATSSAGRLEGVGCGVRDAAKAAAKPWTGRDAV